MGCSRDVLLRLRCIGPAVEMGNAGVRGRTPQARVLAVRLLRHFPESGNPAAGRGSEHRGQDEQVRGEGEGEALSGKGDTARPFAVDADTFASNWARTFGAKAEASSNKVGNENGEREPEPTAERSAKR